MTFVEDMERVARVERLSRMEQKKKKEGIRNMKGTQAMNSLRVYTALLGRAKTLIVMCLSLSITWAGNAFAEPVIERSVDIPLVTGVHLMGAADMQIRFADKPSLVIKGPKSNVDRVQINDEAGVLKLEYKASWLSKMASANPKMVLSIPSLSSIQIHGAGDVVVEQILTGERVSIDATGAAHLLIPGITAQDVKISVTGAGEAMLGQVEADSIWLNSRGAGQVALKGKAGFLNIEASGAAQIDAPDLAVESAQVQVNGAGSVNLWVTDKLQTTLRGAGSVNYYGEPKVSSHTSGASSVNAFGPHPKAHLVNDKNMNQ